MIYVDSNVPMYLVGAEHPNKARVIELASQLVSARERLITSAEAFQEILHRYRAIGDRTHMHAAYEALEAMTSEVVQISKDDMDSARSISGRFERLSARDCVHLAVMERIGCTRIWSYDAGFDVAPSILRIR